MVGVKKHNHISLYNNININHEFLANCFLSEIAEVSSKYMMTTCN